MLDKWLKPDGTTIDVGHMQHNNFAWEYLKEEEGMDFERIREELEKIKESYPYQILHKRGWVRIKYGYKGNIRIMGNCISYVRIMRNTCNPAMNAKQLRVAKKLCKENGTKFLDAINDF